MKKDRSTIALVGLFFVGLALLLYPMLSDFWNSKVQTKVIANYEDTLKQLESRDYSTYFAQAEAYNQQIRQVPFPLIHHDAVPGYADLLNIDGSGVMGYLSIDSIQVEMPIYHGTSPDVLNRAAGHLEGSSLPTGEPGTHTVLSAHRGLPSAKLFTDLDKLQIGDTFSLKVLDRVLTYQVDQILIVEPSQVEALAIEDGMDYCTLVTCTPYGINSHRLLVRGVRTQTAQQPKIFVPNEGIRIDPALVAPIVAAPMLLVLLIVLLIRYRKEP